jgi:hypothetical protein
MGEMEKGNQQGRLLGHAGEVNGGAVKDKKGRKAAVVRIKRWKGNPWRFWFGFVNEQEEDGDAGRSY